MELIIEKKFENGLFAVKVRIRNISPFLWQVLWKQLDESFPDEKFITEEIEFYKQSLEEAQQIVDKIKQGFIVVSQMEEKEKQKVSEWEGTEVWRYENGELKKISE